MAVHPSDSENVFAKGDISGMFRLETDGTWTQTLDAIEYDDRNLQGVQGVALDKNNSNIVYAAAGKHLNAAGDVLKSTDHGTTWSKTGLDKYFGADEKYSTCGEPIAVDPLNSNIVYVITPHEGLYRSFDGAETWEQVLSFPYDASKWSMIFVFGKSSTDISKTSVMYVGVPEVGLYKSTNCGATWSMMTGSPLGIRRIAVNSQGVLYTAGECGVSKYDGITWTTLKTSTAGFGGIDIDPYDESKLITVTAASTDGITGLGNNHVMYSTDAGATWTDTNSYSSYISNNDYGNQITAASCVLFDRRNTSRAYVSDWYGVYICDNIYADSVAWTRMDGIENTLAFKVKSVPISGENSSAIFTGIADINGFKFNSIVSDAQMYSTAGNIAMKATTDIDFCESSPEIIVRVGTENTQQMDTCCAYSTDSGLTWQYTATIPQNTNADSHLSTAHVAVSATYAQNGNPTILFSGEQGSGMSYSEDYGETWTLSGGISTDFGMKLHYHTSPLVSDRVNGNIFYAYYGGKFYISSDRGRNFTEANATGLPSGSYLSIQISPSQYKAGEIWICLKGVGIYKSTNYGASFSQVNGIDLPMSVCLGAKAPGSIYPTVYSYDAESDKNGVYMSIDNCATWKKISDDSNNLSNITCMEADRSIFGQVYVGTNGVGVYYITREEK